MFESLVHLTVTLTGGGTIHVSGPVAPIMDLATDWMVQPNVTNVAIAR